MHSWGPPHLGGAPPGEKPDLRHPCIHGCDLALPWVTTTLFHLPPLLPAFGADYNSEETLSTLRYASRAKFIKNKPKVNEDPKVRGQGLCSLYRRMLGCERRFKAPRSALPRRYQHRSAWGVPIN